VASAPRSLPQRAAIALARLLPPRLAERATVRLLQARTLSLPPDEALRLLFAVDAGLYELQGDRAIALGDGTHAKHRLMGYHDFFCERIGAGERVLDVGCGWGAVSRSIAERTGASVVGIEIEPRRLEQARRTNAHPNVEYVEGDATRAVPGGPYDAIVLSNVLEHLRDRPAVLRALVANASPSRLLIRVPLFDREWRVPLKRELGVEWRLDPTHETEYTLETFAAEMAEAGLEIAERQVRWGELWATVVPAGGGEPA
jgi:SAM-dependent methyltransferase